MKSTRKSSQNSKKSARNPIPEFSPQSSIPSGGFYTRNFGQGELADLAHIQADSLQDEIAMLRVLTRRLACLTDQEMEATDTLKYYQAIGQMCSRISTLMRAEKDLDRGEDFTSDMIAAIDTALQDLQQQSNQDQTPDTADTPQITNDAG